MSQDYIYPLASKPDLAGLPVAIAASAMTDKAVAGVTWDTAALTLTLTWAQALSGADKTALDAIVAAAAFTLGDAKEIRYVEIDAKTAVLLAGGFTYDGDLFPLDSSSQMDAALILGAIGASGNMAGVVVVPAERRALDGSFKNLNDIAAVRAYYLAMLTRIRTVLKDGRDLKKSIFNAVSQAEIDAVVDTRT